MPDTVRTTLALDVDAAALLSEMAPSPRKKGELISELIREAAGRRLGPARSELEALRRDVQDLAARLQWLEARQEGRV